MPESLLDDPPRALQALAHPLRWRLVRALATSDHRVGELSALLGVPQNLVSYHLRELRECGVVSARRSSSDRRDVYYRADLLRCRDLMVEAASLLYPPAAASASNTTPAILRPTHRRRPRQRLRVLFVCTGNSSRSQIAEVLLSHRSGGAVGSFSAGTRPKSLHPHAVEVMARRGLDISPYETKHVAAFERKRFTHVITLCDRAREECPPFAGQPLLRHWSMPDPSAEPDAETLAPFERAADELEARIVVLLAELIPGTEGQHHAE